MASYRNWVGLFLLGTINNLPYVIVTSAASTIADSFDKKNLIGLVFGANVALSFIVKTVNGAFMLQVPYGIRYVINAVLMLIGLFGVAYAPSFWFSLVCIMCVGASSAFGENVALGYLRLFPSKMVNAWSSGTGMAGVLGSLIYITFGCVVGAGGENQVKLRHLTQYAFLLTSPAVAVYLFSYFVIIKAPNHPVNTEPQSQIQADPEKERLLRDDYINGDTGEVQAIEDHVSSVLAGPKEHPLKRIWRCTKLVLWLSFNLCAVYLFEYVAQGCAAKVRPKKEYNIGCPELYASLSLCYQAGVFVSRSSVQLIQIRRVEILSILQCINMVLWVIDVHYKFMPVSILPALMIYVGLLGGASYVNIFYLLLHDGKYPENDRELCINIAAVFITFDSYVDSQAVKAVLDCLKREATAYIGARQKVYNIIMNNLGPSSAIRREVVSNNQSLNWVREQFEVIRYEDKKGEKDYRIHTEKKEHISNQIEALDSQLVNRSRITSARRSRQGTKKVDALRQRVSFLRKQLMDEEEMVVATQRELLNSETKAFGELGKMELVLRDLEKIRIQNITQQTRLFIQSMLDQQAEIARSSGICETLRQCLKDLTQTDRSLDQHWHDVEANALRAQTGQTFKLRQLFEVSPKRSKSADSRKSVDSLRIAEIEANRLVELDGKPKFTASPAGKQSFQLSPPVSKTSSHGPLSPIPDESTAKKPQKTKPREESAKNHQTPDSKRETIIDNRGMTQNKPDNRKAMLKNAPVDNRTERIDNRKQTQRETTVRFSPDIEKEFEVKNITSETSIEEIHLPPETRNIKRITPRLSASKNGWVKSPTPRPTRTKTDDRHGEEDDDVNDDDLEQDNDLRNLHSSLESPRVFSRGANHSNVGKRRNCKVVAVRDYSPEGPGELPLKKGQLIKQKAGEDHRGMCYGWTREHRLFPKKYGFYPKDVVCLDGFQV